MLCPNDVTDIQPFSTVDWKGRPTRTILIEPFPADGFSKAGIYIQFGGGTRDCPNCPETPGFSTAMDGNPGECWRCNGSGRITNGIPYPVFGRVLATGPDCIWVKPDDVVHFSPNAYDEVETSDGRTLHFMRESGCRAIVIGYDDFTLEQNVATG